MGELALLFSIKGRIGEWFPLVLVGGLLWILVVALGARLIGDLLTSRQVRLAERARQQHLAQQQAEEAQRQWEAREQEKRERELAEELARRHEFLSRLRTNTLLESISPIQFEQLVLRIFKLEGWTVEGTKASGDGGIDGRLERDGVRAVLQCKHYRAPVGVQPIRDLNGVVHKERAGAGYMVISRSFTTQAREWVHDLQPPIYLIDQDSLRMLLISHADGLADIGLTFPTEPDAIAYPSPPNCAICGNPMSLLRRDREMFWGCSNYPSCRSYRKVTEEQARFVALGAWSVKQLPAKRRSYPNFRPR